MPTYPTHQTHPTYPTYPTYETSQVISLGILLVGMMRLQWLASRARRIDSGKWNELAGEIARTYDLSRPIRFLETEHPTLLVTWGILRPKIMMPVAAREWPEDRIRVVLSGKLILGTTKNTKATKRLAILP